jgi:hypothetical protein
MWFSKLLFVALCVVLSAGAGTARASGGPAVMAQTFERIEALAPDQASLAAARKLLKPSYWPTLAEGEGKLIRRAASRML